MARGKYLSLDEARKGATKGATIRRFCKEHPSVGDENLFDRLLDAMAKGGPPDRKPKGSPKVGRTSVRAASEGYSGTRTRPGTSEDASD